MEVNRTTPLSFKAIQYQHVRTELRSIKDAVSAVVKRNPVNAKKLDLIEKDGYAITVHTAPSSNKPKGLYNINIALTKGEETHKVLQRSWKYKTSHTPEQTDSLAVRLVSQIVKAGARLVDMNPKAGLPMHSRYGEGALKRFEPIVEKAAEELPAPQVVQEAVKELPKKRVPLEDTFKRTADVDYRDLNRRHKKGVYPEVVIKSKRK